MQRSATQAGLSANAISDLRSTIAGTVIAPDDNEYDASRATFYGGHDCRPAVIVKVAGTPDIQHVIALARQTGLELAVRSGGHSNAGHSTTDGGILLDLGALKEIDLDVDGRTVWAGSGLTAGELTAAVGEHGLVIGFGDTGSVGIGGITLGGGVGYLVRKFGLAIDNLLAADIVTADGQELRASANEHQDLFWAIRGGGGNFGVVTRFQYRLHELPGIVGGMLILPATADTIAGFIALAEAAPEELSGIANVMPCPPMPFVPAEFHGQLVIMALAAYAGGAEAGAAAFAPFRALAAPIADMIRPQAYGGMFPPEDGSYHPTAVSRNMFVDHIDRAVAETILERLKASDAPMRVAQLRVLGGAMARVAPDATAFAHRQSRIMVNLAAFYGATDRAKRQEWVDDFAATLHQGDDGAYVNFLEDVGPELVRSAYPDGTWDRLRAIKRRYDPDNVFHRNQNIPPA